MIDPITIVKAVLAVAGGIATIAAAVAAVVGVGAWLRRRRAASRVMEMERTPRLGMQFWQQDRQALMSQEQRRGAEVVQVALERAPLEIWFPSVPDGSAIRICAWTDDSIFSLMEGGRVDDSPMFGPGRGAADYQYGSGMLAVSNEAHNYLIGTRIAPASAGMGKFYVSTIMGPTPIPARQTPAKPTPLSKVRRDLYLAVFVDRTGDGTFHIGNFEYVVLKFA